MSSKKLTTKYFEYYAITNTRQTGIAACDNITSPCFPMVTLECAVPFCNKIGGSVPSYLDEDEI